MSRPDDADTSAEPDGPSPSVAVPGAGSGGGHEAGPATDATATAAADGGPTDGDGSSDGSPPDAPDAADTHRRRRRTYLLGSAIGLLVAILVALMFVRVPYYRFSPGTLYPTESLITVDGATTYPSDGGQIDFTTVSSKKASVLEALLAHFDDAVELVDADKVDGTNAPEETRRINLEMMADSKTKAEVVALRKLGYPIVVEGSGALVKSVRPGSPADKVLEANDAIVAVDGTPVHLQDDAIKALGKHKPGDTVELTVESAPGEPQKEVTATLASRCDVAAPSGGEPPPSAASTSTTTAAPTLTVPPGTDGTPGTVPGTAPASIPPGCSAEDAAKPILGVTLGTRDTHFDLPFRLSVDTKEVGGPSAGLALTLGIIDVLTPGSLTGGRHVATTGTIELDGSVGPIGGIRQKTYLAMRQGVELFLVPDDEFAEAQGYAAGSSTKVVAVSNLDEALAVLASNGGNTDVVQQAAAANTPGTTPN